MKKSEPTVIVEQRFSKPVDIVWAAITEHNQMVKWFFENIPSFIARVGFSTSFNVTAQSCDFIHLWEIIELTTLQSITYD